MLRQKGEYMWNEHDSLNSLVAIRTRENSVSQQFMAGGCSFNKLLARFPVARGIIVHAGARSYSWCSKESERIYSRSLSSAIITLNARATAGKSQNLLLRDYIHDFDLL